jgi:penicillin-binding protein 1A
MVQQLFAFQQLFEHVFAHLLVLKHFELQKVAEEQIQRGIKEIDKRQGYKGPFAHIGSDEFVTFEKKSRINLFKDKSSYFTLNEHNDKVYEFHFDEKEI